MSYNLTNLAGSGSVYELIVFSNTASTGLLMTMFVLAFFFITLLALKKYEFDSALLVSSWLSFLVSALLVYAELIAMMWALLFLIVAAFTALYFFMIK